MIIINIVKRKRLDLMNNVYSCLMTPLKGKLNAIAISVDRPSTGQSDRSSIDSTASSIQGGVSPIIMKRFLNFTSPEKKICTMNCENCRDIAKQLRTEQVNLLDIPGHGGRRGSTPWSAPCSRKSSCPGPEIIGKRGIHYRHMPGVMTIIHFVINIIW